MYSLPDAFTGCKFLTASSECVKLLDRKAACASGFSPVTSTGQAEGKRVNKKIFGCLWALLYCLFFALPCIAQQTNLAPTPPMGWNSWNKFAEKVDAKTVKEIADAMVSSGMKDAGYIYVNIDDTWQGKRDAQGVLQPNEKFPDMKGLADYVHSKGLKIGIYSSPGPKTCAGYEGSYQHEELDAQYLGGVGNRLS